MDSAELTYWLARERVEPLPNAWLQTGVVAASNANLHRGKRRAVKPEEFMPVVRRKPRQTVQQMMDVMAGLGANGR